MKQTYEQRVRALAERMAQKKHPNLYLKRKPRLYTEEIIRRYYDCARIAVAEMAEQFNNGWSCGVLHANNNDGYKRDDCLKRLGLIPDDGQEAGSDEN